MKTKGLLQQLRLLSGTETIEGLWDAAPIILIGVPRPALRDQWPRRTAVRDRNLDHERSRRPDTLMPGLRLAAADRPGGVWRDQGGHETGRHAGQPEPPGQVRLRDGGKDGLRHAGWAGR